jgi:hypothetical protein
MAQAGNYKVGRVVIHGLNVAIEQPRHSYRTGLNTKTGERWTTKLAAHYGYFSKTRGADGDPVDCFIGFYPQSEFIYIINQYVNGSFDETKCMVAFPDEHSARKAYLDSYDKGWNGLHSLVPASISQFKWWLKNGNMKKPVAPEYLPYSGLENMNQNIKWDSTASPKGMTIDKLLYEIRRADGSDHLLLDSVCMADILEDVDSIMTFDALVTPYAKLERKMNILKTVMERAGNTVKPLAVQISDPFKQNGTAQVAVVFELSDGQSLSVFFHNPDVTPGKIQPTDSIISWKFLLNKKDVTIVVAPEHGEDLNVHDVAMRIMKLAEKNSPAFQKANVNRAAKMQVIEDIKTEIVNLETELKNAQHELEVAKVEAEDRVANPSAEFSIGDWVVTQGGPQIMQITGIKNRLNGTFQGYMVRYFDPLIQDFITKETYQSTEGLIKIDKPSAPLFTTGDMVTRLNDDNAAKITKVDYDYEQQEAQYFIKYENDTLKGLNGRVYESEITDVPAQIDPVAPVIEPETTDLGGDELMPETTVEPEVIEPVAVDPVIEPEPTIAPANPVIGPEVNTSDANIGRTWNGRNGEVYTIESYKDGKYYTLMDGKVMGAPIIPEDQLERTIEVDENWYKSMLDANETALAEEKAKAEELAAKELEYVAITGKNTLDRARKITALSKQFRDSKGVVWTVKNYVEDEVSKGAVVETHSYYNDRSGKSSPERVLMTADGFLKFTKDIGKIGLDYAEELIEKRDVLKQQQEPNEQENEQAEVTPEAEEAGAEGDSVNQAHIDTLQAVVDGAHDSMDLNELLDVIDAAATALIDDGLGEANDSIIGAAAERWAMLDEKKNG